MVVNYRLKQVGMLGIALVLQACSAAIPSLSSPFLTGTHEASALQLSADDEKATLPVAMAEFDWFDAARQRPMKVTIWYPIDQDSCLKDELHQITNIQASQKGANKSQAQQPLCLHPATNTKQTAIFSHGAMGAAKGYQWIGRALAAQGIVTVGLNHYGESWVYGPEHVRHSTVLQFALRPHDATFVLDELMRRQAEPKSALFNMPLNWQHVIAVGHSSGAATMLALAGVQYDFTLALTYCQTPIAATDRSCGYLPPAAVLQQMTLDSQRDFRDPRIKQVIAFDPAMGHLVERATLSNVSLPVLVVGSVENDFLPYAQHAALYSNNLSNSQLIALTHGEGHFVYLDPCTHQHQALGVSICQDRVGVERAKVQQQLVPELQRFLRGSAAVARAL